MELSNELQIGKAGEYLVCADLILKGHVAYLSEQGLSYDVVADVDGKLSRIQVKTTQKPIIRPRVDYQGSLYVFDVRRCGKGGRKKLSNSDVDIIACVALDSRIIGYIPIKKATLCMTFRVEALRENYHDMKRAVLRAKILELTQQKMSVKTIAAEVNLKYSYVVAVRCGQIPVRSNYDGRKRFLSDWSWGEVFNE